MTAGKDHIPALDGLRGFAALAVMVAHLATRELIFPYGAHFTGALGVSLFFTLSGFLMAYLHAGQRFDSAHVFSYAVSRFARIVPVYILVILASYVIYTYVDRDFIYRIDDHNLLRHLLLSGNYHIFWSIPPEIQFYVFFVFMWWSVRCYERGRFFPLVLLAAACCVMLLFAHQAPGTTLPARLNFFLSGAVMGLLRRHWPRMRLAPPLLAAVQGALLAALVAYAGFIWNADHFRWHTYAITDEVLYFSWLHTVFCAAVILFFSYPAAFADGLFANAPMRRVGAWSFSLYLLHEPFFQMAERLVKADAAPGWILALAAVGISLLAAFLAHIFIERPSQKMLKRLAAGAVGRFAPPAAKAAG